ncbi:MAG: hypothetical protein KatS3mg112_1092 [Thermogutta sp.]|nr:MAG: hypothetical protein KatS3mg112_1092 [Thermogutta sp.]
MGMMFFRQPRHCFFGSLFFRGQTVSEMGWIQSPQMEYADFRDNPGDKR